MSNGPLHFQLGLAFLLFGSTGALAQTPELLEAVRLQRPGALAQAVRELQVQKEAGDHEQADRLSLLVGVLSLSEGQYEQATQQLQSRRPPPLLESLHAYYLGQAEFYSQNYSGAAKRFALALKGAPAWLAPRIHARRGEALLAGRRPALALAMLERSLAHGETPELLFQRGLAREAIGRRSAARQDFRRVAVRFPAHAYAESALQRLSSDSSGAFRFEPAEYLQRARNLLAAGHHRRALEELEAAEARTHDDLAQAQVALLKAAAHFALRQEALAQKALDRAIGGPSTITIAAEALFLRAKQAMRASDHVQAQVHLAELERRFPTAPEASEAAFLIGWLHYQAGDFSKALAPFSAYDERHPQARRRDEVRWYRGMCLLRLGRHLDAAEAFDSVPRDFPRSSLVPQSRYWTVRAQQLLSPHEAKRHAVRYAQLRSAFPGTFYGMLAGERLRELGQPLSPLFPKPTGLQAEAPVELRLATALAKTGLFREAREEVQFRLGAARDSDRAIRFGHALHALGDYAHAHQLAIRHLWRAVYGARKAEALSLMYPRAYRETVEKHAATQSVDPFFTWAIMRRESNFRPDVSSPADARGLMQIIPPTATAIARQLDLEAPRPEELFSPELNIRLASWYLGALSQRFRHPALSAAAYNAGPAAVLRWVQNKGSLPLDLFVEEIPYKETRGYVKQVLGDHAMYQSLYGDANLAAPLPLTLPQPAEQGVSF